jgi:hypothetical protein
MTSPWQVKLIQDVILKLGDDALGGNCSRGKLLNVDFPIKQQ